MTTRFAHFSLRVSGDLDATADFYADLFGFEIGARPPFTFPGRWLYLEGKPILHLIGDRSATATGDDLMACKARAKPERGSGAIDHIAISKPAASFAEFIERLNARGIAFARRTLPASGIAQVFVEDPEGVTIEVVFDQ